MDQWKWYADGMPSKDYEDPVQIQVRKLLNRAMIQTFGLFEYQFDELVNKFMPVLPLAHDDCIDKVIQIVKGGQSVCVYEMKMEIAELQKTHPELVKSKKDITDRFTDTCARISSGYIARLLLDTIYVHFKCVKIGTLMELFWEQLCVRLLPCFLG